jgi:type II secretory pathway pseudopilin PulG
MIKREKFSRGFTIVEFTIVILVTGIITGVVLWSVSVAKENGRIAAAALFEANLLSSMNNKLVGEWKFEEGTGLIAVDTSGKNNSATFPSVFSWSTDTYKRANSKYSLTFAGLNYFTLPKSFGISDNDFTIAEWIKSTSSQGQMYNIYNASGGNGFRFGLDNGHIAFLIGNNVLPGGWTESGGCSSKKVNDGKWHYITGVYNRSGGVFNCYIDGVKVGSMSIQAYPNMQETSLPIMGSFYNVSPFDGSLDNLRIYTKAYSGI